MGGAGVIRLLRRRAPQLVTTLWLATVGCLLLARVDGKSPVEYIVAPQEKELVRRIARRLLQGQAHTLDTVKTLVDEEVGAY